MVRHCHMSIDPGVRGTGVAIWDHAKWQKEFSTVNDRLILAPANPIFVKNLMPKLGEDWQVVCRRFFEEIGELYNRFNVVKSWVEFPQFFQSEVGMAATTKGDIYKLSCLVGVFEGAAWAYGGKITPVKVTEWKGQLPKEVIEARIKKLLPTVEQELSPKSHSWDAIGIGLHAQGFLNCGIKQ